MTFITDAVQPNFQSNLQSLGPALRGTRQLLNIRERSVYSPRFVRRHGVMVTVLGLLSRRLRVRYQPGAVASRLRRKMLKARLLRFRCTLRNPRGSEVYGALHYRIPHDNIVVLARKTPYIVVILSRRFLLFLHKSGRQRSVDVTAAIYLFIYLFISTSRVPRDIT